MPQTKSQHHEMPGMHGVYGHVSPRAQDPAVPVHRLLAEIREQGYPGSMNLLYRYITQGRVEADRPHLSPRRVARLLLTRPPLSAPASARCWPG